MIQTDDLLALTEDDWQAGVDLLLMSVIRMARLVTPVMEGQRNGAISPWRPNIWTASRRMNTGGIWLATWQRR